VTEQDWLTAARARPLLAYIEERTTWRKLTLFHVGCCYSFVADWEDGHPIWSFASAVETGVDAEFRWGQVEDRERLFVERERARDRLQNLVQASSGARRADVLSASTAAVAYLLLTATWELDQFPSAPWWHREMNTADALLALTWGRVEQVCDEKLSLLREVFGNPFRPVNFASWRTSTALALARQIYNAREFGALPILADALQDAGCNSEDALNHCRDPNRTHVRGCWVVDGVLGKA
jgi:hypothetical protein